MLLALAACSKGASTTPRTKTEPTRPDDRADDRGPADAADTTGGVPPKTVPTPKAVPTVPRLDLSQARFFPMARGLNDRYPTRVMLGEVEANENEDDLWSVADGIGAPLERLSVSVSTKALAKADLEGLSPLPTAISIVGAASTCTVPVPDEVEVEYDGEGFGVAAVYADLQGCASLAGPLAPIAISGVKLPKTTRYVEAERRVIVSEGKLTRGGADQLTKKITGQSKKHSDSGYAAGVIEGFIDEVANATPPVVTVFAGVTYAHAPKGTNEPDPCMDDATWEVWVGQRDTSSGAPVPYPSHPEDHDAFDLGGAVVHEGHVQALFGELALDRTVLLPSSEIATPGDATEGFAKGRWVTVSTGTHHDEDVAYARHRIGETCEP